MPSEDYTSFTIVNKNMKLNNDLRCYETINNNKQRKKTNVKGEVMEQKLLNVKQVSELINAGKPAVYRLMKENKIRSAKQGKRLVTTEKAVDEYINSLMGKDTVCATN